MVPHQLPGAQTRDPAGMGLWECVLRKAVDGPHRESVYEPTARGAAWGQGVQADQQLLGLRQKGRRSP